MQNSTGVNFSLLTTRHPHFSDQGPLYSSHKTRCTNLNASITICIVIRAAPTDPPRASRRSREWHEREHTRVHHGCVHWPTSRTTPRNLYLALVEAREDPKKKRRKLAAYVHPCICELMSLTGTDTMCACLTRRVATRVICIRSRLQQKSLRTFEGNRRPS